MNFRPAHRSRYLDTFNFSSLTDVVMQLLIFFLLTFSFANTRGMNVTLPKTAVGQPPMRKTVSISIQKDKQLFVNNEAVPKDQLAAKLSTLIQKDADQQIVVRADKDLTLQDVVEILDIAKGIGATKLFIATEAVKEVK
ncbi:MAG: biopolymer transporter ExbD [Bacteroidota bacterium]|nr:biopolymer transporter ExbD [Bacteroidota bacterium]